MHRSPLQRMGDQFGAPSGRPATVVAVVLNVVNRGLNAATVRAVDPQPGEVVVDVGFGGGVGIATALARVGDMGRLIGVERSADLVARARRKLGDPRVEIVEGTAEATGLADDSADALISVNTVYFWPDPVAGFAETARVLRSGGRAGIGLDARILREHTRAGRSRLGSIDEVLDAMRAGGLSDVECRPVKRSAVLVGRVP